MSTTGGLVTATFWDRMILLSSCPRLRLLLIVMSMMTKSLLVFCSIDTAALLVLGGEEGWVGGAGEAWGGVAVVVVAVVGAVVTLRVALHRGGTGAETTRKRKAAWTAVCMPGVEAMHL